MEGERKGGKMEGEIIGGMLCSCVFP